LLNFYRLDGGKSKADPKGSAMYMPFVTTVSFASRDGMSVNLQYAVSAGDEREARSEIERRLLNQELYNYSIVEIRQARVGEVESLNLSAGAIKLLN
jgi:hypothetical protein